MDDLLVAIGGAVKALGEGRIGGLLVPFGSQGDLDLDREYFTARTDFGLELPAKVNLYYHHGRDPEVGLETLGRAELKQTDLGIEFAADLAWTDAQSEKARRYRRMVYELAKRGDLGASSGSAAHVVQKKGAEILSWPLAEASVTVTPASPKTMGTILPLKSWDVPDLSHYELEAHPLLLASHAEAVVSAAEEYAARLESRLLARVKAGRMLSGANVSELEAVLSALDGVSAIRERVLALLEKAKPAAAESEDLAGQVTAEREKRAREQAARFAHIIAGLSGVPT